MKYKVIFLIMFLVLLNTLIGQSISNKCLSNLIRNEKIENKPSIISEFNRIEEFTKNWINENKTKLTKSNTVIILPVVVHIIWRLNEENISDEQIQSQIDVLNEDFRKLNSNFSNTPSQFQNIAADVEIEFRLANIDPNGNTTSGITRTKTTVDNIAEGNDYYQSVMGGKDPWDQKSYINIWICDIGEDGTLGFATFPSDGDPGDGVVIPSQYFGKIGTALNSFPNHLGRTATHEMGHYFNLEHIWGPDDNGCSDDDNVEDTPKQDGSSDGCNMFPSFDDCTAGGNGIMFMNYMDYSDDECMTMFSNGQKLRMLAALNGPRKGLLSSKGLSDVTAVGRTKANKNIVGFYPNPARNFLNVATKINRKIDVKLFNVLGEIVISEKINSLNSRLDLSKINSGVYFLKTNIGNITNINKILISK